MGFATRALYAAAIISCAATAQAQVVDAKPAQPAQLPTAPAATAPPDVAKPKPLELTAPATPPAETKAPQMVERLPLLNSDFPIAAAVTVKSGNDIVFLSGALGPVIDKTAPKGSRAALGDTATQATGALTSLQATLARLGMTMGDVVKMNVFLVGDPEKDGKLDFAGLMSAYTKFFGTKDQPNKPARSAVQVAALVLPGALVEIEVVAAKTH